MRIVTEETVDELRAVGGFFILHRAILVSSDMRYARKKHIRSRQCSF